MRRAQNGLLKPYTFDEMREAIAIRRAGGDWWSTLGVDFLEHLMDRVEALEAAMSPSVEAGRTPRVEHSTGGTEDDAWYERNDGWVR